MGILTAIPEELDAILSVAREVRAERNGFLRARIGVTEVVLAAAGDGAGKAGRSAAALCETYAPAEILGAGVAGALSPELSAGELVASRQIYDASGPAPAPDERLLSRALSGAGVRSATLLTVAKPALSPSEKAVLATSIDGGAAAVDMESAVWAREAAAHGIPYVVIRAISDEAGERLPRYLSTCMDEDGSIRRSKVVARALAHPGSIPELLRMRRRVRDGARHLAAFLERFLSESV